MSNGLHEVAKIMGVDEETLEVYPKIKFERNMLNPWGDELLDAFAPLGLSPGKTVLDIPCGQGGVAVHLAKEYGAAVDGHDLLPGFIANANEYAAQQGVQALCRFVAGDIRAAIQAGGAYDVVLWSAAPHLWGNFEQTIQNLRRCAKPGGYIVIADAYLCAGKPADAEPDYETLDEIARQATAFGDTILKLTDYGGTLWAENYRADRQAVAQAIQDADSPREKEVLEKHLDSVNKGERYDTEHFGLFLMVLQVAERDGT